MVQKGFNELYPNNYYVGEVEIGVNNKIGPMAVIGTRGQHRVHYEETNKVKGKIIIGDNNVIREFTTIHSPVRKDITEIGNNCFLMATSHVAHDCKLYDNVTLGNRAIISGHCNVMDNAFIGVNTSIHQYVTVGSYVIVGMGAVSSKDIPPFTKYYNGRVRGINKVGMERAGFSDKEIMEIEDFYKYAFQLKTERLIKELEKFNNIRQREICKAAEFKSMNLVIMYGK